MKKTYSKPKIDIYIENFFKINRGLFKRLHGYFIYQFVRSHFRSRSKVLVKNLQCKQLTKSQKKEIKDYYAGFGFKNINTEWHRFYTHVSGKFYKEYIPVGFFINVIEPYLNNNEIGKVLTDKNLLDKLFVNVEQPETVTKNINGNFIDSDNISMLMLDQVVEKCKKYSKLIIKPSIESGGGKDIIVFEINKNKTTYKNMSLEEILKLYNEDFIVQNFIIQHEEMQKLNPSSVNTLRIQSLLRNNKVEIIVSYVRIGGKNSFVDNMVAGGVFCNINKEGFLGDGFNGMGEPFLTSASNVKLKGYRIPNYSNILNEIKKLHIQVPYFRIIAWDIAINKEGKAVLIEYNLRGQGVHSQFATGPIFGEFTDEILSECKINIFT